MTVPVTELPPTTGLGVNPSDWTPIGRSASGTAVDSAPMRARTSPDCNASTALVEILNVFLITPAGNFTDAGTVAPDVVVESETVTPSGGAGYSRVIVPLPV